ncbi:hypothetical protein M422DRAFT_57022 [Sphaerobolus stellatus SS14]|uniref:Uncharacterized protein n=1 Tax=Sphaerobolus stellatus (strain SS14) TaxID=990650 RepID=A0A0C9UBW0_SPHS4|nr:hypothetical protein M422DRAFT_57022 [Sphaerobolus stellatus SS14]
MPFCIYTLGLGYHVLQQILLSEKSSIRKSTPIDTSKRVVVISKEEFEALSKKHLQDDEGGVLIKTSEDETKILEQLLEIPEGTLGESYIKLLKGSENCVNCGRQYSSLDVANTGVNVHGKQFLKDVLTGKHGYILNGGTSNLHNCYNCGQPADKGPTLYWFLVYLWIG